MRILWVSHLLPFPPKGGVQQRSYNLLREVSRRHDVTLLAFNQSALLEDPDAAQSACEALGEFASVSSVHSIPADRVAGGRHLLGLYCLLTNQPYSVRWLTSRYFRAALRSLLSSGGFEAVHFDTISLAQYVDEAPSIPATLNHHNIESDMLLRRAELQNSRVKRFYYEREGRHLREYEERVLGKFALHFTCSDLDGRRLSDVAPGTNWQTVPNGVDLSYFMPQRSLGGVVSHSILFAGGLSWYPNASAMQWFMEDIWPLLISRKPEATITIVGRSPPGGLRKQVAASRGARLTGFVPDVRPYMEDTQVYVCPIFDGGGTKLKMLDAMAMGKAIVAHPIACEGIEVVDRRHVLMAQSPGEFVDRIMECWESPSLRKMLGENARALVVEKYSFTGIGRHMADLFSGLSRDAGGFQSTPE